MLDSGRDPRKVGLRHTYQDIGQSSDIGTTNLDVGDRHQTSPKGERSDVEGLNSYIRPHKVGPKLC